MNRSPTLRTRLTDLSSLWTRNPMTDRSRLPGHAPSSHSAAPLYRAPHAGNLLGGSFAGGCDLAHGIEELALGSSPRGARFALIEPAVVLEFERVVITEEFRRADRAVGARNSLCFVDHVGEDEAVSGGERLHVVERVLRIGIVNLA